MRSRLLLSATLLVVAMTSARAQVPLSSYVDANGFIDVQTLTCAQLAGTYQEDADALTAWYSGWYNGLAKKHFLDLRKGKIAEHEVIVYCKANPEKRIIDAIAVVFKAERELMGIQMK
ncbi:HdeA/HdeB family chaperone [Bradyrhizobium sp. CER78]|uniref:HdeA/HdeB family chaperone n=1 Tax=Bradyrhizobium sp. CER78 TaxID=3039162 RepID=UPI002446C69A|nr:HdeA/HdeB family chaperone [Bradyrhizobium sp. CER78]MDH2384524.1 HdeA/HdeB family chaperone [Bradyrhizobium sp. CER78]